MYQAEETWDQLLGKSPDCIYHNVQSGRLINHKQSNNQTKPWITKLKKWLLPSPQAYPLPPLLNNPKKYY